MSQNATGLPDRRNFLSTLTAAGALGLPVLPAMAAQPDHPDAELIELDALLAVAVEKSHVLGVACDEAYKGYQDPPLSECLYWRESDGWMVWPNPHRLDGIGNTEDGTERYTFASEGVLKQLRGSLATWKAAPAVSGTSLRKEIARAEEIVAGVEAWNAEVAKAEDACGATAANRAHDAQRAVVAEFYERIVNLPARTAEGVCIKLRVALAASMQSAELLEEHQFVPLLAKPNRAPYQTAKLLILGAQIDAARLGAASCRDRRAA